MFLFQHAFRIVFQSLEVLFTLSSIKQWRNTKWDTGFSSVSFYFTGARHSEIELFACLTQELVLRYLKNKHRHIENAAIRGYSDNEWSVSVPGINLQSKQIFSKKPYSCVVVGIWY